MTRGAKPIADVSIDPALVRALLREQHADLAHLPFVDVGEGWDNKMFRLGEELADPAASSRRFGGPHRARAALAAPACRRDCRCRFPCHSVSAVQAVASPGHGPSFPGCRPECPACATTRTLRRRPSPWDSFFARSTNPHRQMLHTTRGGVCRWQLVRNPAKHLQQVDGLVDRVAILALWERAVSTPAWSGPPLWIHGDLHPGNLLVSGGRLAAVIDFGDLAAGDPATDLSVVWMLLPPSAR